MAKEVEENTDSSVQTRSGKSRTFVHRPGKTREDSLPVDQRPRVQAAAERYRRLRISQGFDA